MLPKLRILALLSAIVTVLAGCSTLKNTPAARSYHQTKCRYNIEFNAMNSYREGMLALNSSTADDYTRPIEMYPISVPANRGLATSQMETVILKCRKAIKNHSITRKPKLDTGKKRNEKYMYFYNQEEYVRGVKDAWILLGQAELHKGDFTGAAATFAYIRRHFPSDRIISCRASVWLARAYAEQGWLYEAQQAFDAIKPDDVPREVTDEYTATRALLLIRDNKPAEAIPFLRLAVDRQHDRFLKARWSLLLGRLMYENGRQAEAVAYLSQAARRSQNYQLEFNARLLLLQAEGGKWRASIKKLDKMATAYNNRDYLDQIYTARGNIYLAHGDTARALASYETGVEKATREGPEKADLLIRMGDLHYALHQYVKAAPCYTEAVNLIESTHPDYRRVSRLSSTLGELAGYQTTIELQDSLQHLATMPESRQREIVDRIIADLRAKEAADSVAALEADEKGYQESVRPDMNNRAGSQEWYFYNQQLVTRGAQIFKQKWGSRPLEDDWQRKNKVASSFSGTDAGNTGSPDNTDTADALVGNSPDGPDSPDAKDGKDGSDHPAADRPEHDPEYYLAQIPKTDDDIRGSNALISQALYSLARLYDEQLAEYSLALDTHEEFQGRFPADTMNLESLYSCYRIGRRLDDDELAGQYRDQIIARYPGSTYARMLSDTAYVRRALHTLRAQDSLYAEAYAAYSRSDFPTVRRLYSVMQRQHPAATLMPKFAFLDALSIGKTGREADFRDALARLAATYPAADVTATARDILAMLNQGEQASNGTNDTHIEELREQAEKPEEAPEMREFTRVDSASHALVILLPGADRRQATSTLYDIAAYNFTRFMVNTYDLELRTIDNTEAIIVTEFASRAEAEWYHAKLTGESAISGTRFVIISVDDLGIIGKIKTLNDYLAK